MTLMDATLVRAVNVEVGAVMRDEKGPFHWASSFRSKAYWYRRHMDGLTLLGI